MHRAFHLNEIFIPFPYNLDPVNLFWHAIMLLENVNMETGKIIAIQKRNKPQNTKRKIF